MVLSRESIVPHVLCKRPLWKLSAPFVCDVLNNYNNNHHKRKTANKQTNKNHSQPHPPKNPKTKTTQAICAAFRTWVTDQGASCSSSYSEYRGQMSAHERWSYQSSMSVNTISCFMSLRSGWEWKLWYGARSTVWSETLSEYLVTITEVVKYKRTLGFFQVIISAISNSLGIWPSQNVDLYF